MILNSEYNIGDIVYLKTDIEQLERMICKITFYPLGTMYGLACGTIFTDHYNFEVSSKKDMVKELGISGNSIA